MKPPLLDIRGLALSLPPGADRDYAVHALDLQVREGEIVCLVGESGSGKSMVAHSIMGLLPAAIRATGGSIMLDGEDLLAASEARLRELRCARMAMIFQEPLSALNPVLTCGEQVDEVLREHTSQPTRIRRERILACFAAVGLTEPGRMLTSYPHQLSGGQQQRVMIAMALVLEPRLLIADEPTTALDVTTQAQILGLIRGLQRARGLGVLFITHDFGVVTDIADRVAVLRRGVCVEAGPAMQVLEHPSDDYTRMLIGSVPSLLPRDRPTARPTARSTARSTARPSSQSAPAIRAEALSKTYRRKGWLRGHAPVPAVRELSLTVARGETLGVVGESASGKSTVARCIARLIEPTSGRIVLDGSDIAFMGADALRPLRRKVQIIFQDPYRSLNPRRDIAAAIIEGPMNYGLPRGEALRRARDLLQWVGLEAQALTRYPHQFSGGQRQRICIARALAMEPELLIADEAVSALDVSVQAQVLALLDDIKTRLGLAMLFITHDLRVAAQVCDRIAVMRAGEIVETGAVGDIFARPAHPYTQALFAAAPARGWTFTPDGARRVSA